MANEVTVRNALIIRNDNLNYSSNPTTFRANMSGSKGAAPGAFSAGVDGTDVDLSQFSRPGFCWIQNLDDTNYVEVGIHDGSTFYPLMEVQPGEFYIFRISRNIGVEETIPGTGTSGVVGHLCIRANTAACNVRVDAFES